MNNKGINSSKDFYKLDLSKQEELKECIVKYDLLSYKESSYRLKHKLPFYVTNGAFKGAMLELGNNPISNKPMNWIFI